MSCDGNGTTLESLRYIPLSYNHAESQASVLRLILSLYPDWEGPGNKIEFVRFTDGITNTVCSLYTYAVGEADRMQKRNPRFFPELTLLLFFSYFSFSRSSIADLACPTKR